MTEQIDVFIYKTLIYFMIFLFTTYIISFSRFANHIWLILLVFLSFITVYFINTMGIEINKQIIKNAMDTNINESVELLGFQFTAYILLVLVFLWGIYRWSISSLGRVSLKRYLMTIFMLLSTFFIITKIDEPQYKDIIKKDTAKVMPIGIFPALEKYLRTKSREEKIVKKNISSHFKYKKRSDAPMISVLVIGESARADRFSINGYTKNTTPLLSNMQEVISFKDTSSCDTSTLSSVPCLLLRVGYTEFKFPVEESSFVQVFSDKGFDTHWLTLQHEANVIHTFCDEAKECVDMSSMKYDMDVLEKFNKIITSATKDTLIVIHTMGSHIDYNKRVPLKYQKFQPVCTGAYETCEDTLDNSYDNTIYYTDMFLSHMITALEDKNAFLFYTSDHGESLGETYMGFMRRFGHASPYDVAPEAQTNIPFIVWFSKQYKEENPRVDQIDKTQHVSHDFIFSSMLGCSGFQGEYIDDERNLCQEKK